MCFSSTSSRNKSALGVCTGYKISLSYCLSFLQGFTLDFSENPSCFWKGACSHRASSPVPSSAAFQVQPAEPQTLSSPVTDPSLSISRSFKNANTFEQKPEQTLKKVKAINLLLEKNHIIHPEGKCKLLLNYPLQGLSGLLFPSTSMYN